MKGIEKLAELRVKLHVQEVEKAQRIILQHTKPKVTQLRVTQGYGAVHIERVA